MKKTLILVIAVAVVVGAGAFYGGMAYGKSHGASGSLNAAAFGNMTSAQRQQLFANGGGQGASRTGVARANGGFSNGEIIAKDDKSITIKMPDNSTKIVFFSDSTQIGKMASGTAADLTVGETVTTTGTPNSDGSVTAQSIQIRPAAPAGQNTQNPAPPTSGNQNSAQ